MNISTISNTIELTDVKDLWDEMARRSRAYTPFLSYDWFDLWLKHFGGGSEIRVMLVHDSSRLLCIAPMMTRRLRHKGLLVSRMELIGNVYSPIKTVLFGNIDAEQKKRCMDMIFENFRQRPSEWDIMDFDSLPEEESLLPIVRAAAERVGFSIREYNCFENFYLDEINYSADEYLQGRSGNIRQNVPYRKRKLQRTGDLHFRLIRDMEELDHYMDIYYDLYVKSWKKEEGVGPTFHRDLSRMAAQQGWLRLGFLFLDQIPLACQFWINAFGHAYILKLFYDEAYQQYAPGKILSVEMFRNAIDYDRVHTIDYLQGGEQYKRDWTPKKRWRKGLIIYNRTPKGMLLDIMDKNILPLLNSNRRVKRLKDRFADMLR